MTLADLFDPAWVTSVGTAVLGFVGGQVRVHRGRVAKLEEEVKACRERDADVLILTAGVRMVVGKVMREQPEAVELRMFNDLCNRRGLGTDTLDPLDLEALIRRIDEADERPDK